MLDWIANGLMTVQEQKLLKPYPSPTTKHFTGQYQNSQKEPDVLVRVNSQYHPTAVFESGWTESWNRLTNDVRLWLVDGSPNVNVVFLLKWSKKARNNQVSGFVEVYVREITSNPLVRQRLAIFPVATTPAIQVTWGELFGGAVWPICASGPESECKPSVEYPKSPQ